MQSITQKGQMCYNCFQERESAEGPCPHCGFDLAENEKKYPVALRAGTVLNGRYIVGRVLGQGGFGITYLALDTQLNAKVAIKEFMPGELATRVDGTTVSVLAESKTEAFTYGAERFQEEARTLAKFIGNPNIAAVTSYFDENDTSYFVMDYIEGISFKTYIANHGGRVSVEDTLNVMIPVLRALTAVHQEGFIHRDVTPDNIYITKDGMVKLLDFGSARYSIGDKSKSLDVILKVGYAPKEQYIRRSRQGPFTDVYSCAACFYAALTGFLPPESLERLDHDELVPVSQCGIEIPEYLDKAILKGLAVQPEDRFQNAEEFLEAIENQQVVEVPGEQPPAPVNELDRLVQRIKKKPVLFGGIAAAVLVVLIVLGVVFDGGAGSGGRDDGPPLRQSAVASITINGQEYSTNERELELEGMGLTDADVEDLKYMINLTYLNLRGNDITDLSFLTDMTGLRELELGDGNNGITDLSPLAGLTDLRWVGLPPQSQISDLTPLANLTKLESLNFSGNWGSTPGLITNLSPLESLTNLTRLNIYTGTVTDLSPLSGLTKLQDLQIYGDISQANLSDLAGLTSLTELRLSSYDGNSYMTASDLSALSGMTNLQTIDIYVAGLESLDGLENLTNLTELRLYGSYDLQDLGALSGMTKLQNLQLNSSGSIGFLRSLRGMEGLTSLREMRLYVDGLESLEGIQGCTSLVDLQISGQNYTFTDLSPLAPLTKLQNLHIQSYGNTPSVFIEDLTALSGLTELKELDLYIDGISSLKGLEGLTSLTTLNLSGLTGVSDLGELSSLTSLRDVDLNGSGDQFVVRRFADLSALTGLQTLNVSAYGLEGFSGLEGLTGLRELNLSGGDATYTDTSPLKNLTGLQSLSLPSRDPDAETLVDLSGLSGMTGLQTLMLSGGNVASLEPLRGLTNLTELDINLGNQDETFPSLEPLSGLTKLTRLNIPVSTSIKDLSPLGNLTNLQELWLYGRGDYYENVITDISPLANLTNLRSLRIYYARGLTDISPLQNLTNLQEVDISTNDDAIIDTAPVAHVPSVSIR